MDVYWYNYDTVLCKFLETGTSDRCLIGIIHFQRFSDFGLYPLSFFPYTPFKILISERDYSKLHSCLSNSQRYPLNLKKSCSYSLFLPRKVPRFFPLPKCGSYFQIYGEPLNCFLNSTFSTKYMPTNRNDQLWLGGSKLHSKL